MAPLLHGIGTTKRRGGIRTHEPPYDGQRFSRPGLCKADLALLSQIRASYGTCATVCATVQRGGSNRGPDMSLGATRG